MSAVAKTLSVVDSSTANAYIKSVPAEDPKAMSKSDSAGTPESVHHLDDQQAAVEKQRELEQAQQHEQKVDKLASILADQEVKMRNVRLQFEVNEDTEDVVIRVLDKRSGEVIREIPTEEMQELSKVFDELKGCLVNDIM